MALVERAIPVGGAALNFAVVGGTTEPASPAENTIWVNTDTAISGWVFSAAEPTPSSGLVWIKTGSNSPVGFNALKKNELMLMPLSVAQYISGGWVSKTAQSFMNGVWSSWLRYLVQEGVVNTNTAGQLMYELLNTHQSVSYEEGYVSVSSTSSGDVKMYFEDTIDFSEVDMVEVDIYSKYGTYLSGYVGVSAEKTPMAGDSASNTIGGLSKCVASANLENDSSQNRHTVSLDVSGVVGVFYLCLCFASTGGGIRQDNRIYNITLK